MSRKVPLADQAKRYDPVLLEPGDVARKEAATCKPRPTETGGDGSSRPFVPWCDRKK